MKLILAVTLILSTNVFAQTTKAKSAIVPDHLRVQDNKNKKAPEAPCAETKKEDVLKKMEEKKAEQASAGKGFSLQGNKDTGCSI